MKKKIASWKGLSWKPRHLSGGRYCAPACGGDCKHADFQRVSEATAKVAEQLGSGWRPEVWENLGWFGRVVSKRGNVQLYLPSHTTSTYGANAGDFWSHADTVDEALSQLWRQISQDAKIRQEQFLIVENLLSRSLDKTKKCAKV